MRAWPVSRSAYAATGPRRTASYGGSPGRAASSSSFDDRRQAEQTVKLLDANGQQLSLAIDVAKAIQGKGPSVDDVIEEHISLLNRVGEDTRTGYRLRARDHISPHVGPLRVSDVTWQQVTRWIEVLQAKGLSHTSISNVHGLLSAAMNTAVRLGYRSDNPCSAARVPERAVACRAPALVGSSGHLDTSFTVGGKL